MNTFNKIINKLINLDNNVFSLNYDKTDNVGGMYKFFFYNLYNNNETKIYKSKFHFLNETLNNFYFSDKLIEKNEFFYLFYKIQKVYHTLNRFAFLYNYKKSKIIVNNDLQLNDIKIDDVNVICIYHVGSRYLFKIEEMLKIVYSSLTNCFSFFSEPFSIKNPYNNIPFGKSILYYIYSYLILNTKIRFVKSEHLDLFLKFKECDFNMTKFVNDYEFLLREYSIKNYLTNSTKQSIKDQIKIMINSFNFTRKVSRQIIISDEFPDYELIRIMKPYLYLYLVSKYSLVKKNKIEASNRLNKKLSEFQEFNTQFGRKVFKSQTICIGLKLSKKRNIEFNMKHKKFNTFDIDNFMNNHLSYKYDGYGYDEDEDVDEYENVNEQGTRINLITAIPTGTTPNGETGEEEDNEEEDNEEEDNEEEYKEEDNEEEYEYEYEEGADFWNDYPDNDSIS